MIDDTTGRARRYPWVLGGALLVIGILAIHGRAVTYPFAWDDKPLIAETGVLESPGSLARAWSSDFWGLSAQPYQSGLYRPVVISSYIVETAIAGKSPALFHAVNLGLHTLVVLLLLFLMARLKTPAVPATLAAAIFAFHPAIVMPVVNVSSRPDVLVALFLLVAVHLSLLRPRSTWAAAVSSLGTGMAFLLALASKETAAVGLVVLALLPFYNPGKRRDQMFQGLALAGSLAIYLALRVHALGGLLPVLPREALGQASIGILGIPELTLRYLVLGLVPYPLGLYLSLPPPSLLVGLAGGFLLFGLGFLLLRRRHLRGLSALAWFVLALAPVSGWIGAPSRFSQLFLYLPLAGCAVLLAPLFQKKRVLVGGAMALVFFSIGSVARVDVWKDNVSLWSDSTSANSRDASNWLNYGNALVDSRRPNMASVAYQKALGIAEQQESHATKSKIYLALGNMEWRRKEPEKAKALFARSVEESKGRLTAALINLSLVSGQLGDLELSLEMAQRAVESAPMGSEAENVLGVALARSGRLSEARPHFERALILNPENSSARQNLNRLP